MKLGYENERKQKKNFFQTLGHLSVHFKSTCAVVSNNSPSKKKKKNKSLPMDPKA